MGPALWSIEDLRLKVTRNEVLQLRIDWVRTLQTVLKLTRRCGENSKNILYTLINASKTDAVIRPSD